MAHNLDFSNGRANIAFLGSRKDIWHKLGTEMAPGMSIDEWAIAAGLNWEVVKSQARLCLTGSEFRHLPESLRNAIVPDRFDLVRSDTGSPLGYASNIYQQHQPREVLSWFQQYVGVDDRFQIDVAGSLKGGAVIWATASYNGDIDVAGDKHRARLLMTTTFDGSGATRNQATMTRVVCDNTLQASLSDKRAIVSTRHNTKFDAAKVSRELGAIAQGFAEFKAMGDAMSLIHMSERDTVAFFKALLDIPFDATSDDISGKKRNAFDALANAYEKTLQEGTPKCTQWTALNAVTRYVDHDKHTKGSDENESRFLSSNFGSGAAMKAKAVALLMPKQMVAA
jgi:phage/plasmid-like protein (TIGR03299 family)